MFYLKRAVEAAAVLILIGVVVLQLPAGAALVAMAFIVWSVWFVARLFGRRYTNTERDAMRSDHGIE